MEGIISKVCNAVGFDLDTNEQCLKGKTLTESSMNVSVEELLIRAGQENAVIGTVYHSGDVAFTITDQQWDLNYLAMKFGGAITASSDLLKIETVTTTTANQITVTNDVVDFNETSGKIGWYKLSTEGDGEYKKISFTDKTATVESLVAGTTVCVKYPRTVVTARELKIDSNFAPKTIRLILDTPLLKSSTATGGVQGSSEVGKLYIDVPQFQFNPTHDTTMSSGSASTTALSGRALVNYGNGCEDSSGYFCIIKEEAYDADEFDNVSTLIIPNSDIDLVVGDTHQIEVYKMYSDGTTPAPVSDISLLTFTSKTTDTATVGATTGSVSAVATGQTIIEVVVTANTSLSASCAVTVTANS